MSNDASKAISEIAANLTSINPANNTSPSGSVGSITDSLAQIAKNTSNSLRVDDPIQNLNDALLENQKQLNDFNTLPQEQYVQKYGIENYNKRSQNQLYQQLVKESQMRNGGYSGLQLAGDTLNDVAQGFISTAGLAFDAPLTAPEAIANSIIAGANIFRDKDNKLPSVRLPHFGSEAADQLNSLLQSAKSDYAQYDDAKIAEQQAQNIANYNAQVDEDIANGETNPYWGAVKKFGNAMYEGGKTAVANPRKMISSGAQVLGSFGGYGIAVKLAGKVAKLAATALKASEKSAEAIAKNLTRAPVIMGAMGPQQAGEFIDNAVDNMSDAELFKNYSEFKDYYDQAKKSSESDEDAINTARTNFKNELYAESMIPAIGIGGVAGMLESRLGVQEKPLGSVKSNLAKLYAKEGKTPSAAKESLLETLGESVEESTEALEPILAASSLQSEDYDAYSKLASDVGNSFMATLPGTAALTTPQAAIQGTKNILKDKSNTAIKNAQVDSIVSGVDNSFTKPEEQSTKTSDKSVAEPTESAEPSENADSTQDSVQKEETKQPSVKTYEDISNIFANHKSLNDTQKANIASSLKNFDDQFKVDSDLANKFNLKEGISFEEGTKELASRLQTSKDTVKASKDFVDFLDDTQAKTNNALNVQGGELVNSLQQTGLADNSPELNDFGLYVQNKLNSTILANPKLREQYEKAKNISLQDVNAHPETIKASFSQDFEDDKNNNFKQDKRTQAVEAIASRSMEVNPDVVEAAYKYITSSDKNRQKFTDKQEKIIKDTYEHRDVLNNVKALGKKLNKFSSKFRKDTKEQVKGDLNNAIPNTETEMHWALPNYVQAITNAYNNGNTLEADVLFAKLTNFLTAYNSKVGALIKSRLDYKDGHNGHYTYQAYNPETNTFYRRENVFNSPEFTKTIADEYKLIYDIASWLKSYSSKNNPYLGSQQKDVLDLNPKDVITAVTSKHPARLQQLYKSMFTSTGRDHWHQNVTDAKKNDPIYDYEENAYEPGKPIIKSTASKEPVVNNNTVNEPVQTKEEPPKKEFVKQTKSANLKNDFKKAIYSELRNNKGTVSSDKVKSIGESLGASQKLINFHLDALKKQGKLNDTKPEIKEVKSSEKSEVSESVQQKQIIKPANNTDKIQKEPSNNEVSINSEDKKSVSETEEVSSNQKEIALKINGILHEIPNTNEVNNILRSIVADKSKPRVVEVSEIESLNYPTKNEVGKTQLVPSMPKGGEVASEESLKNIKTTLDNTVELLSTPIFSDDFLNQEDSKDTPLNNCLREIFTRDISVKDINNEELLKSKSDYLLSKEISENQANAINTLLGDNKSVYAMCQWYLVNYCNNYAKQKLSTKSFTKNLDNVDQVGYYSEKLLFKQVLNPETNKYEFEPNIELINKLALCMVDVITEFANQNVPVDVEDIVNKLHLDSSLDLNTPKIEVNGITYNSGLDLIKDYGTTLVVNELTDSIARKLPKYLGLKQSSNSSAKQTVYDSVIKSFAGIIVESLADERLQPLVPNSNERQKPIFEIRSYNLEKHFVPTKEHPTPDFILRFALDSNIKERICNSINPFINSYWLNNFINSDSKQTVLQNTINIAGEYKPFTPAKIVRHSDNAPITKPYQEINSKVEAKKYYPVEDIAGLIIDVDKDFFSGFFLKDYDLSDAVINRGKSEQAVLENLLDSDIAATRKGKMQTVLSSLNNNLAYLQACREFAAKHGIPFGAVERHFRMTSVSTSRLQEADAYGVMADKLTREVFRCTFNTVDLTDTKSKGFLDFVRATVQILGGKIPNLGQASVDSDGNIVIPENLKQEFDKFAKLVKRSPLYDCICDYLDGIAENGVFDRSDSQNLIKLLQKKFPDKSIKDFGKMFSDLLGSEGYDVSFGAIRAIIHVAKYQHALDTNNIELLKNWTSADTVEVDGTANGTENGILHNTFNYTISSVAYSNTKSEEVIKDQEIENVYNNPMVMLWRGGIFLGLADQNYDINAFRKSNIIPVEFGSDPYEAEGKYATRFVTALIHAGLDTNIAKANGSMIYASMCAIYGRDRIKSFSENHNFKDLAEIFNKENLSNPKELFDAYEVLLKQFVPNLDINSETHEWKFNRVIVKKPATAGTYFAGEKTIVYKLLDELFTNMSEIRSEVNIILANNGKPTLFTNIKKKDNNAVTNTPSKGDVIRAFYLATHPNENLNFNTVNYDVAHKFYTDIESAFQYIAKHEFYQSSYTKNKGDSERTPFAFIRENPNINTDFFMVDFLKSGVRSAFFSTPKNSAQGAIPPGSNIVDSFTKLLGSPLNDAISYLGRSSQQEFAQSNLAVSHLSACLYNLVLQDQVSKLVSKKALTKESKEILKQVLEPLSNYYSDGDSFISLSTDNIDIKNAAGNTPLAYRSNRLPNILKSPYSILGSEQDLGVSVVPIATISFGDSQTIKKYLNKDTENKTLEIYDGIECPLGKSEDVSKLANSCVAEAGFMDNFNIFVNRFDYIIKSLKDTDSVVYKTVSNLLDKKINQKPLTNNEEDIYKQIIQYGSRRIEDSVSNARGSFVKYEHDFDSKELNYSSVKEAMADLISDLEYNQKTMHEYAKHITAMHKAIQRLGYTVDHMGGVSAPAIVSTNESETTAPKTKEQFIDYVRRTTQKLEQYAEEEYCKLEDIPEPDTPVFINTQANWLRYFANESNSEIPMHNLAKSLIYRNIRAGNTLPKLKFVSDTTQIPELHTNLGSNNGVYIHNEQDSMIYINQTKLENRAKDNEGKIDKEKLNYLMQETVAHELNHYYVNDSIISTINDIAVGNTSKTGKEYQKASLVKNHLNGCIIYANYAIRYLKFLTDSNLSSENILKECQNKFGERQGSYIYHTFSDSDNVDLLNNLSSFIRSKPGTKKIDDKNLINNICNFATELSAEISSSNIDNLQKVDKSLSGAKDVIKFNKKVNESFTKIFSKLAKAAKKSFIKIMSFLSGNPKLNEGEILKAVENDSWLDHFNMNFSMLMRISKQPNNSVQYASYSSSMDFNQNDTLGHIADTLDSKLYEPVVNKQIDDAIKHHDLVKLKQLNKLNAAKNNSTQITQTLLNYAQANGFNLSTEKSLLFEKLFPVIYTGFTLNPTAHNTASKVLNDLMNKIKETDIDPNFKNLDQFDQFLIQKKLDILEGTYDDYVPVIKDMYVPFTMCLLLLDDSFKNFMNNEKFSKIFEEQKGNNFIDKMAYFVSDRIVEAGNTLMSTKRFDLAMNSISKNRPNAAKGFTDIIANLFNTDLSTKFKLDVLENVFGLYDLTNKATDIVQSGIDLALSKIVPSASINAPSKEAKEWVKNERKLSNNSSFLLDQYHLLSQASLTEKIKEGLRNTVNGHPVLYNQFVLDALISDLTGRTKYTHPVQSVIKQARSLSQRMREIANTEYPKEITKQFKQKHKQPFWKMLNRTVAKTDLCCFRKDLKNLVQMTSSRAALNKQLGVLKNTLSANINNKAFAYADNLAEFLVTGKYPKFLVRNAKAICLLTKVDQQYADILDKYITVKALTKLSDTDLKELNNALTSEPEGMQFLLNLRFKQQEASTKEAEGTLAEFNQIKGFLPKTTLSNKHIKVIDKDDLNKYKELGYSYVQDLEIDSDKCYIYSWLPETNPVSQGGLQNIRQSFNGSSYTGISELPKGDVYYGEKAIGKNIAKITSAKLYSNAQNNETYLPIINAEGEVIGYELGLNNELLESKLDYDNDIRNRCGKAQGKFTEIQGAKHINEKLINACIEMYEKDPHKDKYINLFDLKSLPKNDAFRDDPIINDALSNISKQTKKQIADAYSAALGTNTPTFLVRRDMVSEIIGERQASVTDVYTGMSRFSPKTQKILKSTLNIVFGAATLNLMNAYSAAKGTEMLLQNYTSFVRNSVIVKSGVVPIANFIQNMVQLIARGVPPSMIFKETVNIINQLEQYSKIQNEIVALEAKLAGTTDTIAIRRIEYNLRNKQRHLETLTVKPLIDAGEFSSIADVGYIDENIDIFSGKWNQKLNEFCESDLVPQALITGAKYAVISKDTAIYRFLHKSVQYGDFIGKAIYLKYLKEKKGYNHEDAMRMIADEFVDYDKMMGRSRAYLESIGQLWFMNYAIRMVKVTADVFRTNPVRALLLLGGAFAGVESPVTDSLIGKMFFKNLGYLIGPDMMLNPTNFNLWFKLFL